MKHLESRLPGEISITSDMQRVPEKNYFCFISTSDTTLMAETKEELKSLLMKVKEESKNIGLKLNFQKIKIMASGPITSWEIDGKTVEIVKDFIFGAPKSLQMVNAAVKLRRLLLGRKAMINLDRILKSRDITLPA